MSVAAMAGEQSSIQVGSELELFARARNWKRYWSTRLKPYLGTAVLEVGAGLGTNTAILCTGHSFDSWLCLEPDSKLAGSLSEKVERGDLPRTCDVKCGTVYDIPAHGQFDTILYVDVLEHIVDDMSEVKRASELLSRGGHLWVLAPAHDWLFSPFDEAVGHYRRYNKAGLECLTPAGLSLKRIEYVDTIGLLASVANRALLRQDMPRLSQIRFWDSVMIPLSRLVDPVCGFRLGKSIMAIWRRL